ncbi:HK97 family phage prohead protease [Riemerella anatipestifer]|nr:HK97 family phage prohead protease [Riemerella anatipestifer]
MSKKQTFLVSDESENSHGFKVLTEGIDTTQFEKNPIMLYMHERPQIIGKWENLKKEDGKLYADAIFDTQNEKGKEVERQVKEGFLRGASIGITYDKKDLKNGVLEQCKLFEISIVDIGSNPNALKLYDTEEFIKLYMNDIVFQNTVANTLQLEEYRDFGNIINSIELLKADLIRLTQFEEEVKEEQETEAEALIEIALQRKAIPQNLVGMQRKAFKEDYISSKKELIKAIYGTYPIKTFSPILEIEKAKRLASNKTGKNKANWSLEEYRKFAPNELEKDPELYQRLINEAYENKNI